MARPDLDLDIEPVPAATAGSDGGARDSRVRYRVLASACALAVLAYLHRVGFATAAPELKAQTGLTDRDLATARGTPRWRPRASARPGAVRRGRSGPSSRRAAAP